MELVLKRASTKRARQDRELAKKDKAWHSVERTSKLTSRESKIGDTALAKKDKTWHSAN